MRIGIDLGGTKIEGAVLNEEHDIECKYRINTPQNDYQATLDAICSLVERLEAEVSNTCSVGVGTPGAISKNSGLMKNCNSTCLNHQPLLDDLRCGLNREVRIANDADCFALSEAIDGAAKDARTVFGVIIGTGTGGGICVDNKLLSGPNGIAGEWGHNPLISSLLVSHKDNYLEKRSCYCGKNNCIETFLSGSGLTQTYQQHAGIALPAVDIYQAYLNSDSSAEKAIEDYCLHFSMAIAGVINILDPDVIVLGGGLSNMDVLYERVPELLEMFVFSDSVETSIKKARFGDSSGVRGAAWLW